MSFTNTVTSGVRSATYNPEAERAYEEQKKEANEAKKSIRDALTKNQMEVSKLAANPNAPPASVKEAQSLIDGLLKFMNDNPELKASDYKDKYQQFTEVFQKTLEKLKLLTTIQDSLARYELAIQDAESKKQLVSGKKAPLEQKLKEIKTFIATPEKKTTTEIQTKFELWKKEFELSAKDANVNIEQRQDPAVLKQEIANREQAEKQKFSFSRFMGTVQTTATTIITSLFYIMFCLVMGMLAANDAIGREPAYRILYFLYGCIFAPFLLFYYVYRWYKGTAPKIYTLLPYTQTKAETSLGRFFKFPFTYQEDKVARDLMVDFLRQSAEAVGKKFDPATLGTIGHHAEKALENMKNMTAEAGEAANKAVAQILPDVSKIKVNAA
jgi:hypothetical protein